MTIQTCLITGGAGFIGSHLAEYLLNRGHRVIVVDDLSTGRASNLAGIIDHDRVEYIEGSVVEEDLVAAELLDLPRADMPAKSGCASLVVT